ncbi:tRNA dihydrouridine synthase Dus1 [Schizosaccharomyces japonicus yFS275]|uniref:tRNA-dihydrouridine(16/17) synthase [NAD(P)(+)] n=1 Tax=Schizosaccharomyces japonicus (strain yFS275 / FY16936) TaxID=402676 RepID=B6JXN4_SCHJY|nr:tRNA dihydrouridine synthase Dus1 [Schizosaccharomyces japonicus yFS275]EEB05178.1 tRNA dihydrouridine synthase Dus1 [Schizosaccharomyces japonicus yFS275]
MTIAKKLHGRAFYESIGSPKRILAPMVDQSELPWRILARRSGADMCFTPMFHSRLFSESKDYRDKVFSTKDIPEEKPLIVQFCGNEVETMLQAAKLAEPYCVAVDLNLGCPQGIARKGKYGSFMQDNWELIEAIISKLHAELSVPVTAKIRIFPDPSRTLEYAKMILRAGASILTVHGRTREQRGINTGIADWDQIKMLREKLPADTVLFANGNILHSSDIERCLEYTGVDGVMSAEGSLYNPKVFLSPSRPYTELYPRVDKMCEEYFDIVREHGLTKDYSSLSAMKGHLFKILHSFLSKHTDLRQVLGVKCTPTDFESFVQLVQEVRERIETSLANKEYVDDTESFEKTLDERGYPVVPFWRAQPYIRPLPNRKLKEENEEDVATKKIKLSKKEEEGEVLQS